MNVLALNLPSRAAVALFFLALSNGSPQLNLYMLYQDAEAKTYMHWIVDNSGWKGPKAFDAFADADNGTSIAYVTMST